jgi:tetratricopeptide (TPR) repeat protein
MTARPDAPYQRLLTTDPPWDQGAPAVIDHIGRLVDLSADLGQADGARQAIQLCDRLRRDGCLSDEQAALLFYFEANAWGALVAPPPRDPTGVWDWTNEAFENQVRRLRQAKRSPGFSGLDPVRRAQVHTNLGNALDFIGRFVEALECYEQAVRAYPVYGMARGNLGICLCHYGSMQPHLPHRAGLCTTTAFLSRARSELAAALALSLEPNASPDFAGYLRRVEELLTGADSAEGLAPRGACPGASSRERRYRRWCLARRLFLNPLNDLGPFPEAASDVLHLPGVVAEPEQGRYVLSLFNQIKQEYAAARFLLYEGLTARAPHFADRDVTLADTLDSTAYSLSLQKTRLAFRAAYSVLDKLAFLLNTYLALGVRPERVNFRKLWHENEETRRGLKQGLKGRENWPLRGLFWLSRDLCAEGDDSQALDPDAQDLVRIRNHAEHRHLTVHEDTWLTPGNGRYGESPDGLGFAIGRRDFESRALRALKLVRSALVYLIHAVLVEEQARAATRPGNEVVLPLVVNPIDDRVKR